MSYVTHLPPILRHQQAVLCPFQTYSVPNRGLSFQIVVGVPHIAVLVDHTAGVGMIRHTAEGAGPTAVEVRILAGEEPRTLVVHNRIQDPEFRSLDQGAD